MLTIAHGTNDDFDEILGQDDYNGADLLSCQHMSARTLAKKCSQAWGRAYAA